MARPELGTKRLCPNCGAKYYDLNRDPILCPKCNASFVTGVISAREVEDDDDELDTEDGIDLVPLEEADGDSTDDDADVLPDDDAAATVPVDTDDAALIDDDDDTDEVSDVVRGADKEEEER